MALKVRPRELIPWDKLLVIPMKGQYEQQCNAAALKKMDVPVIKSLKKKHLPKIENWINNEQAISVEFKDQTEEIIDKILTTYSTKKIRRKNTLGHHIDSLKKLKENSFEKIISKLSL